MFLGGHQGYAIVTQRLFVDRHFILVSRKAVKLVDQHDVPRLFLRVLQHSLKVVSVVVGAGHGSVYVCVYDHHIVMLGVGHALSELTFNGLFGLPLAGIAGIDDCCFHGCKLLSCSFVHKHTPLLAKCKLTDVATFDRVLHTFDTRLNRLCLDLILRVFCIHDSPFCPKGTPPPSEKSAAVKVQSKQFLSTRKKFASMSVDLCFSAKFFHLDGRRLF